MKALYLCNDFIKFADMALPLKDQRYQYLRFEGLQYTDADIVYFEMRLGKIYMREGQSVFTSRAWRQVFKIRVPLVHELILEFFSTFIFREAVVDLDTAGALQFQLGGAESGRHISDKGDLSSYWREISAKGDFLGTPSSYTLIKDSMLRLCHGLIACSIAGRSQAPEKVTVTNLFYLSGMDVSSVNVPYLLARYLRLFSSRRKQGAMIFGGQIIYKVLDDTYAWIASRPKRQSNAMACAPEATKDAPAVDEGASADPTPIQALRPPHAAPRTLP
uniref:Uncharacterized protein n=1 Tax=Tanacetum cinerariifolium TaxID=118510 RepID=A0A6L2LMQ4_TANCI|nr:hypothetical protein [Tanacetum cinerariifolium]